MKTISLPKAGILKKQFFTKIKFNHKVPKKKCYAFFMFSAFEPSWQAFLFAAKPEKSFLSVICKEVRFFFYEYVSLKPFYYFNTYKQPSTHHSLFIFKYTPLVHPNPSWLGYSPPPAVMVVSITLYFSIIFPVSAKTFSQLPSQLFFIVSANSVKP